MKQPLYNSEDRLIMRKFPESFFTKVRLLDLEILRFKREIHNILEPIVNYLNELGNNK